MGAAQPAWCDNFERELVRELKRRPGPDRAVKLPELAAALGTSPRQVQKIVHHLVVDHGARIGSGGGGLYWIVSAEELERTCATMRKRALNTLRHLAALTKQNLPELLGQLRLEV